MGKKAKIGSFSIDSESFSQFEKIKASLRCAELARAKAKGIAPQKVTNSYVLAFLAKRGLEKANQYKARWEYLAKLEEKRQNLEA